jgi:hypothetical protein
VKHLVNAFLVPLGVALATAAPAAADHQPMAMGAQAFELAANGEHEVPAFCRDHDLVVPGARTQLGNVAGATIEVCNKAGSCLRLPEAIAGGWIRVRGTGDYRVRFENLTKGSLSIKVGEGAIVSDAPVTDTRPFSFKLPVDRYDPFTGYRGWRELGQVGAIRFVTSSSTAAASRSRARTSWTRARPWSSRTSRRRTSGRRSRSSSSAPGSCS